MPAPAYVRLLDRLNPLMRAILHSPVHWILSAGLMAITITGRRTGRTYTIPVGYQDLGDVIVVMVRDAPGRTWWRNFQQPHPARLQVRGRSLPVHGLALDPASSEYRERAEQTFRRAGFIAKIFDVDFDPVAGLSAEQQRKLAGYAGIVRFTRDPEPDAAPASG